MFLPLLLSFIDSSRVYTPPDPPGYFDGHVWPMYLKNRREMENTASGISEHLVREATSSLCVDDILLHDKTAVTVEVVIKVK